MRHLLKFKKKIYKTKTRPVDTYGSEVWKENKKEKHSLEIFEQIMLRKIYGGNKVDNVWLRRTNVEINKFCREPSIKTVARAQRIRLLEHVARLTDERPTKQVLTGKITGRRRRGRPPTK
ncbi:unnamed protein product [Psylliodes chrysocephalus]|uniref:Uncharacterized protein n=1 Tax=Psylliodes chrysocephalus TaxID=3402493 RepID=A0A9P0GH65_9CUCU|nr:unnamed protein product [Psylliodes chrysocephala]